MFSRPLIRPVLIGLLFVTLRPTHGVADDVPPPGAGEPVTAADGTKLWRFGNKCAVNSLYLLLRLRGKPVTYPEVEAVLPVTANGTNLADVRRCAEGLGLRCRVIKTTPEALYRCPLPAIAHTEEQKATTGHYVVITAVGLDGIEAIDGTSAAINLTPMGSFRKAWTGYLLVTEDEAPLWRKLSPAAIASGGLALALAVGLRRLKTRDPSPVEVP
jgi:hypothetical protein